VRQVAVVGVVVGEGVAVQLATDRGRSPPDHPGDRTNAQAIAVQGGDALPLQQ
jgi:hypothetical protein